MALFKIFKGPQDHLGTAASNTDAAHEGYAYFTTDNGKFYIDIADAATAQIGTNRIPLNADKADKDILGQAIEQTYVADINIINGTVRLYAGDGSLIKTVQIPTALQEKTFAGIIGTANDAANASFYFGKILPNSYNEVWQITYEVIAQATGETRAQGRYYVTMSGVQSTYINHSCFNTIMDTSYRPIYYQNLYRATQAGITNNYGHLLGVGLRTSWNRTVVANARTITIKIMDCKNCSFIFFDNVMKYANAPGTGTTNYSALTEIDAYNNGLRETGDDNSFYLLQMNNNYLTNGAVLRLHPYTLFGLDRNGNAQSISLYSAGYTSSTTNINTGRVYNTAGIDWTKGLLYLNNGTNFAVNSQVSISPTLAHSGIDFRNTDNCVAESAANNLGLVNKKPVFFRGVIKEDGLFYIAPIEVTYNNATYKRAWTQDIPTTIETDGTYQYVYWFIGYPYYNSSYPNSLYQMNFFENNPVYWYKDGRFQIYMQPASVSQNGIISTDAQTFSGDKTFTGNVTLSGETDADSLTAGNLIVTGNTSVGDITVDNITGRNLTASQAVVTDANKKITTANLTVSSATAESTTATTFVHSVTQDAQGKITVKTRPLPTYNNYSLPLAASGTRGGIQIGYTQSGQNYPVQLSSEKAYVNVPWTDTKVTQKIKSDNNDYRIILSYEANDTDNVTNTVNKASNLRYNPSLNKLSTGNLKLTGELDVTGNASLHSATSIDSLTVGSLIVNGNSSFVNDVSFTKIPTAPTAAAGTNNTQLATTAFVMNAFTANDAMVFKGVVNSASGLPATHSQGWTYKVGTAGSYVGTYCEVGDLIICITDGTSANNAHWAVIQNNVDGAVFMGHVGSAIGGTTQPVYVKANGEVIAGTALKALAYKDSISYTPEGTIANTSITPAGTISSTSITPAGTNAKSAVTIKATTTDVYSMTSAGSVTAGTAASLTMTVENEVLSFSWTANTPTAVTLPGRSSVIKAWTGYTTGVDNTYAAAQVFTGTAASHSHTFTGTAASHNHTFTGTAATLS